VASPTLWATARSPVPVAGAAGVWGVDRWRIGVVVHTAEAETAWNAFRFAVKALDSGHAVRAFLIGQGVECGNVQQGAYDVPEKMRTFAARGGELFACGTCLRARPLEGSALCPVSTMQELVDLTTWADRVLSY
jgi:sulfur relay (sulfurtransferase) complex TusBCD TusD component (DsrE family)